LKKFSQFLEYLQLGNFWLVLDFETPMFYFFTPPYRLLNLKLEHFYSLLVSFSHSLSTSLSLSLSLTHTPTHLHTHAHCVSVSVSFSLCLSLSVCLCLSHSLAICLAKEFNLLSVVSRDSHNRLLQDVRRTERHVHVRVHS